MMTRALCRDEPLRLHAAALAWPAELRDPTLRCAGAPHGGGTIRAEAQSASRLRWRVPHCMHRGREEKRVKIETNIKAGPSGRHASPCELPTT
jgi:hypothetical protein